MSLAVQRAGFFLADFERQFDKLLIFYRVEAGTLNLIRLMHGARDLPRRLIEPPESVPG